MSQEDVELKQKESKHVINEKAVQIPDGAFPKALTRLQLFFKMFALALGVFDVTTDILFIRSFLEYQPCMAALYSRVVENKYGEYCSFTAPGIPLDAVLVILVVSAAIGGVFLLLQIVAFLVYFFRPGPKDCGIFETKSSLRTLLNALLEDLPQGTLSVFISVRLQVFTPAAQLNAIGSIVGFTFNLLQVFRNILKRHYEKGGQKRPWKLALTGVLPLILGASLLVALLLFPNLGNTFMPNAGVSYVDFELQFNSTEGCPNGKVTQTYPEWGTTAQACSLETVLETCDPACPELTLLASLYPSYSSLNVEGTMARCGDSSFSIWFAIGEADQDPEDRMPYSSCALADGDAGPGCWSEVQWETGCNSNSGSAVCNSYRGSFRVRGIDRGVCVV